jgi:bifunctional non-homologous end joining protein LigD
MSRRRLLDRLDSSERQALSDRGVPETVSPMLAKLTHEPFSDPDWIYERKYDGERAVAIRDGGAVRLATRNGKDITDTYPELAEALAKRGPERFVADGEVVAFDGAVTSFARLQGRMQIDDPAEARASGIAVFFYLFDLIQLDGRGLEDLPLRRRKSLLRAAIDWADPIRFSTHRNRDGEAWLRIACEKGWEGLIAKNARSGYVHGRSAEWKKFKCSRGQELVIGGYTPPQGERRHFGALLVGWYDGDGLRYAGKVGTGFDEATLDRLHRRMDERRRATSPFADPVDADDATFVTPDLVGEFAFTEWTAEGKLRHPRFLGLRRDKDARDVTREAAA